MSNASKRFIVRPYYLRGGRGENVSLNEFDPGELKRGIEVEREHTNDPCVALMIATDHLAEFRDYYTRLKKMEDEARKFWAGKKRG